MSASVLEQGWTLCSACRARDAELVEDPGERWQRPLCFECADDVIDRMNALGENWTATEALIVARKEAVYRPLPTRLIDWETADHTKINALAAQWRAYQGLLGDGGERTRGCWAMVPAGTRCVRDEAGADGLCSTHQVQGCRVPGLGWDGDEPRGPIVARRGKVAA
jgi:hypothetical protein